MEETKTIHITHPSSDISEDISLHWCCEIQAAFLAHGIDTQAIDTIVTRCARICLHHENIGLSEVAERLSYQAVGLAEEHGFEITVQTQEQANEEISD